MAFSCGVFSRTLTQNKRKVDSNPRFKLLLPEFFVNQLKFHFAENTAKGFQGRDKPVLIVNHP